LEGLDAEGQSRWLVAWSLAVTFLFVLAIPRASPAQLTPTPGDTPAIGCGQSVTGALDPGDPALSDGTWTETYRFTLTARGSVTFTMTTSEFEPYLFILDGASVELASGISPQELTLPAGEYQVVANNYAMLPPGSYPYHLRMTCGSSVASPTPTPTRTPSSGCVGDCNDDGGVTIHELVLMVGVALGNFPMSDCEAGDANGDRKCTIDEMVGAVASVLNGCGAPGSPTATPRPSTPTPTPTLTPRGHGVPFPATFTGSASVRIEYYSLYGGVLVDTHSFTVDASLWTSAPSSYEHNPFSMLLVTSPPPNNYMPEGLFNVSSYESVFQNGILVGGLQFWDITVTGSGFEGELTDTHQIGILPYPGSNVMNAIAGRSGFYVVSLRTITEGATISAEVDERGVHVTAQGALLVKSLDDLEPYFSIQFDAPRTR
jgi:hypothetical protein